MKRFASRKVIGGLAASLRRSSVLLSLILVVSLTIGCDAGVIRKLAAALAAQSQGACDTAIGSYDHLEAWDSRMRAEEVKLNLVTTPLRLTTVGID